MVNSNHAGFEWRLNFARELLPNTFMFEVAIVHVTTAARLSQRQQHQAFPASSSGGEDAHRADPLISLGVFARRWSTAAYHVQPGRRECATHAWSERPNATGRSQHVRAAPRMAGCARIHSVGVSLDQQRARWRDSAWTVRQRS
ncbi:hypothetical protein ANO11243_017980 [Dothideomycetidae sp. 11243]|nr:hypothetical protein ANO11243_017980 [fungal sp. No.11243]